MLYGSICLVVYYKTALIMQIQHIRINPQRLHVKNAQSNWLFDTRRTNRNFKTFAMFVRKNLDTFQPFSLKLWKHQRSSRTRDLLFTTFRRIESWVFRHLDLLPSWVEGLGFLADAAGNSEFCYAYSPFETLKLHEITEITVTATNGHGETIARHRQMIKSNIHMSTI